MATSVPASPLRYPGGKQSLAPFVRLLLEGNKMGRCVYAEPYAGGAGLALRLLMDGVVERVLLNDKCPLVTTFWNILFHQSEKLIALIEKEPVNMETWYKTREITKNPQRFSSCEVAFSFFFQNRTNFSGVIDGGVIGGKKQEGKYKLNARYPKSRLIKLIEKVAQFHSHVDVSNMDAIDFMKNKVLPLGKQCLTYCDPPYYEKGQALYLNSYEHNNHIEVSSFLLSHANSMRWLVSYDNAPQIVELYKSISIYCFDLPYSANRVRRGNELLVLSPKLELPNGYSKILELKRLN